MTTKESNTSKLKLTPEQERLKRKLELEYRHLSDELDRLTRKNVYSVPEDRYLYPGINTQVNQIYQCQRQIVKELEDCTGVKIPCKTFEDTLKEYGLDE